MNRSTINLSLVMLIIVGMLSGCGFYHRSQARSKIQQVNAELEEHQRDLNRYLPDQARNFRAQLDNATNMVEVDKNHKGAMEMAEQVATNLQNVLTTRLPRVKRELDQKINELTGMADQTESLLARAQAYPAVQTDLLESELESFRIKLGEYQRRPLNEEALDEDLVIGVELVAGARRALGVALRDEAIVRSEQVQNAWEHLEAMGTTQYVPDASREQQLVMSFMDHLDAGEYVLVYDYADELLDELEQLEDRVRVQRVIGGRMVASQSIARASAMNAGLYAPEQLRAAIEKVERAGALFDVREYDEAYEDVLEAISAAELSVQILQERTEERVAELRSLYETAEEIGTNTFRPEAFQAAELALQQSFVAQTEARYDYAARTAEKALAILGKAVNETRQDHAERVLGLMRTRIDQVFAEDAELQLPEQVAALSAVLTAAENAFVAGVYDQVHVEQERLLEKIELFWETLKQTAEETLAQVELLLESAREAQAMQYAQTFYDEALQLWQQAQTRYGNQNYKECFAQAREAQSKASLAQQTAYEFRAVQAQDDAQFAITEALEADALNHSPVLYNQALDALEKSRTVLNRQQFKEALLAAELAIEKADQARLALVNAAQQQCQKTADAGGEQYASQLANEAFAKLAQAKTAMDFRNYEESNQAARQARQLGYEAEQVAWKTRTEELLNILFEQRDLAVSQFAEKYAETQLQEAQTALVVAQAEFAAERFAVAYQQATEAEALIQALHRRLDSQAEIARHEFHQQCTVLRSYNMGDEEGQRLVTQVLMRLADLDQALEQRDYRTMFRLYEQGLVWLRKQTDNLKLHNVQHYKNQRARDLERAHEQGLVIFLPEAAQQAAEMIASATYNPIDAYLDEVDPYEGVVSALYQLGLEMQQWQEQAQQRVMLRLDALRNGLESVRADGARQLVPDEYQLALEAYERVLGSQRQGQPIHGNYHALARDLMIAEEDYQLLSQTTRAYIAQRQYIERVGRYIADMNSLMLQFEAVTKYDYPLLSIARSRPGVDIYRTLQKDGMSTAELLQKSRILLDYLQETPPPRVYNELHLDTVMMFDMFYSTAELFDRFGKYEYPDQLRYEWLQTAFQNINRIKETQQSIIVALLNEGQRYDVSLNQILGLDQRQATMLQQGQSLLVEELQ